tara:strand:+ start:155 stop:529 length:375 start_codon:yes stop_codon:yes gene_type:complete
MLSNKTKILFIAIITFQLFYLAYFRSEFNLEIFKNSFSKDYGSKIAVPKEVNEAKIILKKKSINNFNLSSDLKSNTLLYQRFIEFNYPIRIKKTSKFIISFIKEDNLESCKIIETGKYVKLSRC